VQRGSGEIYQRRVREAEILCSSLIFKTTVNPRTNQNCTRNFKSHDPYHPYHPYFNLNLHSSFGKDGKDRKDGVFQNSGTSYITVLRRTMTMIDSPTPYRLGSAVGLDYLDVFTNSFNAFGWISYHLLCSSFFEPIEHRVGSGVGIRVFFHWPIVTIMTVTLHRYTSVYTYIHR
jgi:hypothetical protein